ncbi:MAG: hypothetical protein M1832_004620 [Thelocarpon impressellum]|nr:MAG: hypothetical protein M1832_004620 [Thelocarpon impressellum]
MTEFYQDVKKLHPDQYLLNEQVPEKWFDVFDEIREKYPGAGEDQRRRFRAQVGFIQQKAQSTEWREYLIQYLKADLPEELSRLPGLLDERESILRNFLRDFGRVAQLDDSRGESPAAGHKDVWALLDGLVHSWVLALRSRSWREFFYSGAVLALLVLIIISGSVCVGFAMSTARTPECGASAWDDNFYALLAQMLLLVYSLYLIVVPLSRNGVVPASGWWFWACLVTSAACSLASVAIYPFHWKLSTGLAYMSGAMQVTATVQLVEGLDKKMKEQDLPASTSS